MWIDEELPPELADKLRDLGARGDALAREDESGPAAIALFREALSLVPEPKEDYLVTTWLLVAIGDTAYLDGDLATAAEAFRKVGHCEGWHTNPFTWLRRGQIAFDTGDMDQALGDLASAFMLGGYEIFDSVDDQYPIFALGHLRPPVPAVEHRLAIYHKKETNDEPELPGEKPAQRPWWKVW